MQGDLLPAAITLVAVEHSRRRRVDSEKSRYRSPWNGASPRARGRRCSARSRAGTWRSIPAGAGSTATCSPATPPTPEHPRGRGVDPVEGGRVHLVGGASPRARGRRPTVLHQTPREWSIPAGAGSTRRSSSVPQWGTEHPRGRGVDSGVAVSGPHPEGASPRARGRPGPSSSVSCCHRSIPAGAGSTKCKDCGLVAPPEHPRGRGVDRAGRRPEGCRRGASPRARGRPPRTLFRRDPRRSIPAGAGSTAL